MKKHVVSIQQAAHLLIEAARDVGLEDFPDVANDVLENNSHDEIVLIGQCLPAALRELLPKRLLQ
jgi:hypothetical protein